MKPIRESAELDWSGEHMIDNAQRKIWYVVDSTSRVLTKPMTKRDAELWAKSPLTTGLYPQGTSVIAIES